VTQIIVIQNFSFDFSIEMQSEAKQNDLRDKSGYITKKLEKFEMR
jgi:hypothetical protein